MLPKEKKSENPNEISNGVKMMPRKGRENEKPFLALHKQSMLECFP
jgi:hypothetical protein